MYVLAVLHSVNRSADGRHSASLYFIRYTLHCIKGAEDRKSAHARQAKKVYRGIGGGHLPTEFVEPNEVRDQ